MSGVERLVTEAIHRAVIDAVDNGDFGDASGHLGCDGFQAIAEAASAAAIRVLGLTKEWIVRHESGGGSIHQTYRSAKAQFDGFVERPAGVEDPGSGRLVGVEVRWGTPWVEVDGSDQ